MLRSFDNSTNGYSPNGSLVQGADGNLYGTTSGGGTNGAGTIFKMTTSGAITVLKSLDNATTGSYPQGSLMQGTDGAFYGMTSNGGSTGAGLIFKITPTGTYSVLKEFNRDSTGYSPYGSLAQGSDGTLYGMTTYGGSNGDGTIFKFNPTTKTITVLRHLKRATDGANPYGSLVIQKASPKAIPQSVTTKEDTAKAITLSGMGVHR